MPTKKTKKSRNPSKTHDPTQIPALAPPQINRFSWKFLLASGLGLIWILLYLRQPIWPVSMVPLDADSNGPRWLLFLAPDQMLDGWLNGPVNLSSLTIRLAVFLPACIVWAVSWDAGRRLLRAFPPLNFFPKNPNSDQVNDKQQAPGRLSLRTFAIEKGALAIAIGLSLHSLIVLFVGIAGGIGHAASSLLIALLTLSIGWLADFFTRGRRKAVSAAASIESVNAVESAVSSETECAESNASVSPTLLTLGWMATATLACLVIARSFMPPAEYDVREYHLQGPKEWSQDGQIHFLPHNIYTSMPMGAELHTIATIDWWRWTGKEDAWWWGALSGKIVIAGYALLAAILAGAAVRRRCGPLVGIWMTALALAMPALCEEAGLGLVEPAVACYFAGGILLIVSAWSPRRGSSANVNQASLASALWIGFFAGSALACKYPALLFVVLPLGIAAAWGNLSGRNASISEDTGTTDNETDSETKTFSWKPNWRHLAWFSLAVAVTAGPWFAKNLVFTGNPVYPLAGNVFGGRTMTDAKIEQWNEGHKGGPITLSAIATAAETLSWKWKLQSMLLVPLALLGIVCCWSNSEVRQTFLVTVCLVVLWFLFTHRIARFLVPILPLVVYLAGFGCQQLVARVGQGRAVALLLFGIVLNGLMIGSPLLGDSRILVTMNHLRADVDARQGARRIPEHLHYVNERMKPTDKLLVVGDAAVFDYEPAIDYATTFDQSQLTAITSHQPPEQWQAAFHRHGWTHLLIHWGEIERLRSTYGFDEAITKQLVEQLVAQQVIAPDPKVFSNGLVEIYKVNPPQKPSE